MSISRFSTCGFLSLALQTTLALPSPPQHEFKPFRSIFKRNANGPWLGNFPDPGLIEVGNTFYAFSTNSGPQHIPVAFSSEISSGWNVFTDNSSTAFDALPTVPSWYTPNCQQFWAPDVFQLIDGSYNLLFAGPSTTPSPTQPTNACANYFCIGVATSTTPYGPFAPADEPVKCDSTQSIIDPSHFVDVDNRLYYLYSGDGNLNIQEFDYQTGTAPQGDSTVILTVGPNDNGVVEAPFMINSDGTYFLFYSTGTYSQPDYTVSYATSSYLLGPYMEQGPLLQTGTPLSGGGQLLGPGGATLIPTGNGNWYMAFHGLNSVAGPRPLYTATISIQDGKPIVM